jgi:hypothetical protein
MSKPKHGGKRLNAGRKRLPPKKKLCIPLDDSTFDQLRLLCKTDKLSLAKETSKLINNTKK